MWTTIPDDSVIGATVVSLQAHGIDASVVSSKEEAARKLLELLPSGSEVFTVTSMTLEALGVLPQINQSGNYGSVRKRLTSMNRETEGDLMRKIGASPDWVVGSVHAVTQDGTVMIASNTGSQLAAYVQGAGNVLWIVGAQKIVKNIDDGFKRIYEHSLPMEDARMRRARGVGSFVSKILLVNKEVKPRRITLIFVKEVLGF